MLISRGNKSRRPSKFVLMTEIIHIYCMVYDGSALAMSLPFPSFLYNMVTLNFTAVTEGSHVTMRGVNHRKTNLVPKIEFDSL